MFAISHAATALAIKRRFPDVPMAWLLISVQLLEILWVIFNLAGLEHPGDMPYSHSVASSLAIAFAVWLVMEKVWRRRALASAAAMGIVSHLVLDLVTHGGDIALVPFASSVNLGLGLYDMPPLAAAAATTYGVLCWLIFGGGKGLLAVILFLNLANLSFLESPHDPGVRVLSVAAGIAVTVTLVWLFSRSRAAALEHPDRRLARAFA
jgi:membrane-bound metal-dependent hydrolase YbcI (DUF457 family)